MAANSNAVTLETCINETSQALGGLRNMIQETVHMCEGKAVNMRSFHFQVTFRRLNTMFKDDAYRHEGVIK